MQRWNLGSAVGAVLSLILPFSAQAADVTFGSRAQAGSVLLAQYDGPPFGGPGGYDMPPGDMQSYPGAGDRSYPGRRGHDGGPRSGPGQRLSYHGFRIDLAGAAPGSSAANDIAAAEHQIEIVDSVGLSLSDLKLFRRMPIRVIDGLGGGPGHYGGGSTVQIGNVLASDSRPILLHEYMHALHYNRLPGGYKNPTIMRFYQEAVASNLYESGSYMLKNPGEFFAVTASCYLYGTVAREPYNRETIRARQPDYYAYLEQLFGRGRSSSRAAGPEKVEATKRPSSASVAPGFLQVGV